jgi:hypothetical protein
MIGCRSRASIAPNHCRQVQSLDYSTTKRAWCFSGSHSSTDDGFKSGLHRVRPATEPVLPSRRIGRLLRSSSSMPIAALRSARLKKRTWRNRAKIQRSTISTAPYRSGSSLCQRRLSTLITAQLPVAQWHAMNPFKAAVVARRQTSGKSSPWR